jgi:hypothetical protein
MAILRLFTLIIAFFKKPLEEVDLSKVNHENASKLYFSSGASNSKDALHRHLNSYVHGIYGVSTYQNDNPKSDRQVRDGLFAAIVAYRSRSFNLDTDKFDYFSSRLEENNLKTITDDTKEVKYLNYSKTHLGRLAAISILLVNVRAGHKASFDMLTTKLYKNLWLLDLLIPDFRNPEEYLSSALIFLKYGEKIAGEFTKNAVLLNTFVIRLIYRKKLNGYCRAVIREL